jgi:hypothetical protein
MTADELKAIRERLENVSGACADPECEIQGFHVPGSRCAHIASDVSALLAEVERLNRAHRAHETGQAAVARRAAELAREVDRLSAALDGYRTEREDIMRALGLLGGGIGLSLAEEVRRRVP